MDNLLKTKSIDKEAYKSAYRSLLNTPKIEHHSYIFRKKLQNVEAEAIFQKLHLLIKLRLLEGPLFIYALQEILNQVKQLFIIQLEKGADVTIPKQLRQSELPMSYQYYNCLFGFISQTISLESKNFILNAKDDEGSHRRHR